MSNEKINVSDLTDALASRISITKKSAELFATTFQDVFQKALLEDKLVKITGLGTFRLQWVEPRLSVNVQTGDPIEIEGHYKVVFAPESGLKNRVNEPFAHLETTFLDGEPIANEPVKAAPLEKLATQAAEIQTMLTAINEPEIEEEIKEEVVTFESLDTAPPIPAVQSEPTERTYTPVATIEESKPILSTISNNAAMITEQPKRKLTWLWILLVLLVLLAGGYAVYHFYGSDIKTSITNVVNKCPFWNKDTDTDVVVTVEEALPILEVPLSAFDQPRDYSETLANVRLPEGGRLTLMARKYYGHKDFWVYIYEANKEQFPDPNNVEVGSLIRVPKLNPELIDVNNPEALIYARKLHDKYLGVK